MMANRNIAIAASAIVALVVLAGLWLAGSPAQQRLVRLDERRVADLAQLAGTISLHWERFARLPGELNELVDGQLLRALPGDPETATPYAYEIAAADAYRLCATFAGPSEAVPAGDFWAHREGRQCFSFRVGIP
jgi:hypothetical protein